TPSLELHPTQAAAKIDARQPRDHRPRERPNLVQARLRDRQPRRRESTPKRGGERSIATGLLGEERCTPATPPAHSAARHHRCTQHQDRPANLARDDRGDVETRQLVHRVRHGQSTPSRIAASISAEAPRSKTSSSSAHCSDKSFSTYEISPAARCKSTCCSSVNAP